MPTPHELEVAKRQDVLRRHGDDFYVQEVVELMDSDDTDAGEEDLPRDERTSARKARRAEAARAGRGRPVVEEVGELTLVQLAVAVGVKEVERPLHALLRHRRRRRARANRLSHRAA